MKKYLKVIKLFLVSFLFFIIQVSFLNSLNNSFFHFNLLLFLLVYILISKGFKESVIIGFFVGFFLDIFSFTFFGVYTASILMALFLSNFLLLSFFTNKSIYSFLSISFFFVLFYNLFLYILLYFFARSSFFSMIFFINFLKEVFFVVISIIFSFYFLDISREGDRGRSAWLK